METIQEIDMQTFASKIGLSQDELMRQSLISFIFNKLREVKTELLTLQKKHNIETVFEFENLYKEGKIDEENSWKDLQLFDKLSFQEEIYNKFLKKIM